MTPGADAEAPPPGVKAEPFQWDVDMEVQLFYAMAPHKPVGVNKHFHMAAIWQRMSESITRDITTEDIWSHLETLYDISMLDDTEPIPFPNDEADFSLPDNEFGEYIKKKISEAPLSDYVEEPSSPPVSKASTPKSVRATSKEATPKARKESAGGREGAKSRKESGSSHASTDTPTSKSEKDYGSRSDRRRDSRDSNASGPRESSGRKSGSHKTPKSRTGRTAAWGGEAGEPASGGRGRRRAASPLPPTPAKRRRT